LVPLTFDPLEVAEERAMCEEAFREDCLRKLSFNFRVPQRPHPLWVTRECLCFLQARLTGAAFSLGTFFVAVDKESASPVGATNLTGSNLHERSEPEGGGAWTRRIIPTASNFSEQEKVKT